MANEIERKKERKTERKGMTVNVAGRKLIERMKERDFRKKRNNEENNRKK